MEDFYFDDGYDDESYLYNKVINIQPMTGGFVVRYRDKNPNYAPYTKKDDGAYDAKVHHQWHSRQVIFTDSAKLVEFLNTRINKDNK